MDICEQADGVYNDRTPADVVAYQIPPFLVPAHSAAVVVIPDEVSGGLRQYGWFTGACCRIRYHDMIAIRDLAAAQNLSPTLQEAMFRYLSEACGSEHPDVDMEKMRIGASMLSYYTRIGAEDQIFWLRHDAEVRRGHLTTFYCNRVDFNDETAPDWFYARTGRTWETEDAALRKLLEINLQQVKHNRDVMVGVFALLPKDKATKIAELCRIDVPTQEDVNSLPQAQVQNVPTAARQPLAPVSANVQVPAPVERTATTLKRKRQDPAPKKMSEVVDLLEESEDENVLQNQVDALQAKIAAIRQRTAHEDRIVPSKKSQSTRKPPVAGRIAPSSTTTTGPVVKAVARIAQEQSAATTPPNPVDPFQPPPSSQNRPSAPTTHASATGMQANKMPVPVVATTREEQRRLREPLLTAVAGKRPQTTRPVVRDATPISKQQTPAAKVPKTITSSAQPRSFQHDATIRGDLAAAAVPRSVVHTNQSQPIHDAAADQPIPRDQPALCKEQQDVVDCIMAGHNVFYTGSAGCGKSTVLKTFVPLLREKGKIVRIVAPTGKAALDINGSTTWTFAGWTPLHMKRPLQQLLKDSHGKFVNARLRRTDVLVIDEISMVENHLFARLNAILKEARGDPRAFGGVQLIVTGDFCQLPPVKPFQYCIHCGREQPQRIVDKEKIVYRCPMHGDCNDEDKWAFRSAAWEECGFKHVNLTNIHRQSDEVFIKVLQKLRIGTALTETDRRLLLDHPCDITHAVKLFPTRDQVKCINQTEFDRLTSAKHSYTCLDMFSWNKDKHPHLESKGNRSPYDGSLDALREHRLDTFVEYKKDMLVVLLVNLDIGAGLVNGSQGRIVGFEPNDEAKLPKANRNGPGGSSMSSRLASSQRKRMRRERDDSAEPEGIGSKGELRGEYAFLREGQIRQFISNPRNKSKMWPIVEFDNGQKRTIYADCQVNELGDEREYTLLARTQVPLIAAWAMTIHKSQGMTLNKVIVDLGKSFEEGQEYVALSRARSLEGLKVMSLGEGVGKGGNAQVKEFLWRKFKLR